MNIHLTEKEESYGKIALRYYAPYFDEKIHGKILELLNEIRLKHNIDYEIIEVSKEAEQKIYRKDFVSRARILSGRIGGSVAKALRSRRGRGYVYLRGTIALVLKNRLEWFATYTDPLYEKWKSFDRNAPTTIGFLKMILEKGKDLLEEIMDRRLIRKAEHEQIVDSFIDSNILKLIERPEREVLVGKGIIIFDKYGKRKEVGKKIVDIICKTSEATWVIEAKPSLDAEAIGQALIYRELYKRQHPHEKVKCGVVCKYTDKELYEIGKKYLDEIFVLGKIREKGIVDWRR